MRTLRWYLDVPLAMRLFVAVVAGALVGVLAGERVLVIAPLGDVLILALRVLAPAVVAVFVTASVSGTTRIAVGGLGGLVLVAYSTMAALASAVGTVIAVAWARRVGSVAASAAIAPVSWREVGHAWLDSALRSLDGAVVVILVASVPIALALGAWRDARPDGPAPRVHRGLQRAAGTLTRLVGVVMEFAPVSSFALTAVVFGRAAGATGQWMAAAFATVYTAQVVMAVIIVVVAALVGQRMVTFASAIVTPTLTALVTGSSAACLPAELQAAEVRLVIAPSVARFVLPLGMAVSKVGTTTFLAALTVVAGVLSGRELDPAWLAQVAVLAAVTGMVTPPIAGGGYLMLGVIFGQLELPMALVPLLIGIPFIGKLNTPLNTLARLACVEAVGALVPAAPRHEVSPTPSNVSS